MASALRLDASWTATAAGGDIVTGDPAREFDGVSIDSRTLSPGALYVALRGDRFDGADFAGAALAAGAAGLVMPRGRGLRAGTAGTVIEVDDTTRALQAIGRAVRRASGAVVVAITGSAGKTTTKDVTAALLERRYRVVRNAGNLNNHIGLPLSLVDLRWRPEMAVVELGMNHAGEIRTLVQIAEPDVRVWTNVGEAHIGSFVSMDAIADAKAEILEFATPDTLVVANADDDRVTARVAGFPGRVVTFGLERPADVRATSVEDLGVNGSRVRVETRFGVGDFAIPLVGRGNVANVLAAVAVALEHGVALEAIVEGVASLRPSAHRGEVLRLAGGVTVIDDSYNANPSAVRRALDVLATSAADRRVAVLGEMLELGAHAVPMHEQVGALAGGLDVLITVGGGAARALGEAAIRAGMSPAGVRHVATSEEAAELAASLVRPGDLVLVKGSRGIRTDRVVDRLVAEHG